jgi:hypothetical protein
MDRDEEKVSCFSSFKPKRIFSYGLLSFFRNGSNELSGLLKGPYKAVKKVEGVHSKASPCVPSLENNNNHSKIAEAVEALK